MVRGYTTTNNGHFLHTSAIFVKRGDHRVITVLGSCIAVCLWDPVLKLGGMNHYMLPLWNGEGLPSPRYGNIAITKLIEKMLSLGSQKASLKAKIFGGASSASFNSKGLVSVGDRNIMLARDILGDERIPILGSDVGGKFGRKVIFFTDSGSVLVRKLKRS
jgi:chemotaxis protein CheD